MSTSAEEVAAISAVVIALEQHRAAVARLASKADSEQLSMWVDASRRSAQRALLQRGPWRLSGRLGRRSRT